MKATATVSRTARPLPGPGALRESVLAVRSVLDASGKSLGAIAVKVQVRGDRRWKVLDCLQLINSKTDQLAHLCFEIDPSDPIDGPGLKQLGRDLRRAAKRPLILLGGEGYRQIDLNGVVSECFVWRNKIHWISEAPAIRVIAPVADSCGAPPASCTVEAWNREVGSKFRGNHYMIVMFGAALSAPLGRLLGLPPLSLLAAGESSTGKSATQSAAKSVILPGLPLASASGTALGLQQLLSAAKDQPVFLQEIRQMADPAAFNNLIFDISNNAQRTVGTAAQTALSGKALNCTLIASNERGIAEIALGQSVHMDAGLYARVFELHVQGPHGMFHKLPDGMSGAEFAEMLVSLSAKYYGAIWDEWIKGLARKSSAIRQHAERLLPNYREHLVEVAGIADPVSRRMVHAYASWQFAAIAANKLGLISLTESEIKAAFEFVLVEHQARRAAGQTPLDERVIEVIRAAIDRNPNSFSEFGLDGNATGNRLWGYKRVCKGKLCYLFFRTSLEAVVNPFGFRDALRVLKKAGLLLTNEGCDTLSVRMPPGKLQKRFYAVDSAIRFDG